VIADPRLDEVRELLDLTWETWRFEQVGDAIVGTLRHRRVANSEHSHDYPLLILEPQDGGEFVGVHAFHRVLWDEVVSQDPQPGDAIGVKYLGRVHREGSPDYERFTLAVVKTAPAPTSGGVSPLPAGDPSAHGASPDLHVPAATVEIDHPAEASEAHEGEPGGGGDTSEVRARAWSKLVSACGHEGVTLSRALAAGNPGRSYPSAMAPDAALEEIEQALAWLLIRAEDKEVRR
jgi:hypothetical protein